jgi:hypothetical protein
MCFTYPDRQMAETMAPRSASFYETPFVVFEGRGFDGDPVICTCPLDQLECRAEDILVIYEPVL